MLHSERIRKRSLPCLSTRQGSPVPLLAALSLHIRPPHPSSYRLPAPPEPASVMLVGTALAAGSVSVTPRLGTRLRLRLPTASGDACRPCRSSQESRSRSDGRAYEHDREPKVHSFAVFPEQPSCGYAVGRIDRVLPAVRHARLKTPTRLCEQILLVAVIPRSISVRNAGNLNVYSLVCIRYVSLIVLFVITQPHPGATTPAKPKCPNDDHSLSCPSHHTISNVSPTLAQRLSIRPY